MAGKADRFIDALHRLERDGDLDTIAGLFAQGATTSNPLVEHDGEGEGGARAFWGAYRAAFDDIRSEFRNIVEQDHVAMLEWVSEGNAKGGGAIRYGGVSVIEWGEDGITAFRAYFDPAKVSSDRDTSAAVEARERETA